MQQSIETALDVGEQSKTDMTQHSSALQADAVSAFSLPSVINSFRLTLFYIFFKLCLSSSSTVMFSAAGTARTRMKMQG